MAKELTVEEKVARFERMQATAQRATKRRNARIKLLCEKAKKAGIEVSDKEIDDYIKKNG